MPPAGNKRLSLWIEAARPRTLPLSLAGIITGSALANTEGGLNLGILIFALLTTLSLQVLSNFSNDYGDAEKGTDNAGRLGPRRLVGSGLLSASAMKKGMLASGIAALLSGILLIYTAFLPGRPGYFFAFLLIGLLAIWAAVRYTVGKRAYGYSGLGDAAVLLFFGFVSVCGIYFLNIKRLNLNSGLEALVIGCLSASVLHLNNMRDSEGDALAGKNTLAVKLGPARSKTYFLILILLSMAASLAGAGNHHSGVYHLLVFIPVLFIARSVWRVKQARQYNDFLKPVAMLAFTYSLLLLIDSMQ